MRFEVVHSLAKWKRHTLGRFDFQAGEGLFVHMIALRPDEDSLDQTHSVFVDQWEREKVIPEGSRNLAFLKETVRSIYTAIKETEQMVEVQFGIKGSLPPEITFIHSEDLVQRYPNLSGKERESAVCKEFGAVFLIGIGVPIEASRKIGASKSSKQCSEINAESSAPNPQVKVSSCKIITLLHFFTDS